jgi:hypothetical protein
MLDASKMSQGNVRQERQLIRVAATPAACTVPPVHSPWTLIAVAGPCSPPRIEKALQAAVDLGERRARDFERMVRFCKSRIACQQSHECFDAAVLTEARRQLGLNIDDATCDANRKRLVPILAIKAMPKKDTAWAT